MEDKVDRNFGRFVIVFKDKGFQIEKTGDLFNRALIFQKTYFSKKMDTTNYFLIFQVSGKNQNLHDFLKSCDQQNKFQKTP